MSEYRYPFTPYPNSWYRVANSADIKPKQSKRVSYFGKELLVFRGEDGQVGVIDAYCAHLGADLGQGEVIGNTIACPFHGWQYDIQGQCQHIPYCDTIPRRAQVNAWKTLEQDGIIMVYYHCDGAEPDFVPPDNQFRKDTKWNRPMLNVFRIRMHIQEVAENAVDTHHFPKVHAYAGAPAINELTFDGPRFTVQLDAKRYGMNFVGVTPTTITYHGFGIVHANLETKLLNRFPVELAVLLTTTPVDEEHCEIQIMACHRKSWNPLFDWLMRPMMLREIRTDFYNDIPIWESKIYQDKPVFCKDDGPIYDIRKWAVQFYSENISHIQAGVKPRNIPARQVDAHSDKHTAPEVEAAS